MTWSGDRTAACGKRSGVCSRLLKPSRRYFSVEHGSVYQAVLSGLTSPKRGSKEHTVPYVTTIYVWSFSRVNIFLCYPLVSG
jgi:hypothetical protein